MSDMSNKNASTIVFPLPMDIMEAFKHMKASPAAQARSAPKDDA
jgi:hypothetical protein